MPKSIEFTARTEGSEVVWEDPDGNPAMNHKLHVSKGNPQDTIEFTFKDKTGLGLKFDDSDAFYVWEQDGCPPPGINTDQIELVKANPNKVQILNRNSADRTLHYLLNVVGKDGKKWPCDPIIKNEGGG